MSAARYIVIAAGAYYLYRLSQQRAGVSLVQKISYTANDIARDVVSVIPENLTPPTGFNITTLLNLIARAEANRGYDSYYARSPIRPPKPISTMTIAEVQAYQDQNRRAGSASSAVGRYQFIAETLNSLVRQSGTSSNAIFNAALQDAYAVRLMQQQGLDAFRAGRMSAENFAARLARVWAGLPRDASGVSHYVGVGDNRARVSWGDLLNALRG